MERTNNFNFLKIPFSTMEYKKLILFGSRARGDAKSRSDYDILVIIEKTLPFLEKSSMATRLRQSFAHNNIDADVIIKSEDEIEKYKNLRGSIVRNALLEGIQL